MLWNEINNSLAQSEGQQFSASQEDNLQNNQETAQLLAHYVVSIKKVSKVKDQIKGHTTLPVNFDDFVSLAILDSGARINITSLLVWEHWQKPKLCQIEMNMQLADASLNTLIRIFKNTKVESCGIEYKHTFVIVDFVTHTI